MTHATTLMRYRLQRPCWCNIRAAWTARSLSIDDLVRRDANYEMNCRRNTCLSPSRVTCLVVLLVSILAANAIEASGEPLEDSGLPQSFSIESGDFLVVQATIDGREYSCMLDTGASCTILDTSLASLTGGTLSTTSIKADGGAVEAQVLASPEIRLGKFVVPSGQQCVCMNLSLLRMLTGKDVRGVLGPRSFGNIIIQADFDSGLLRLMPPKSDALVDFGVPTRIRLDRNFRPFVVARIGNSEQETLIDTGTLPIAIETAVSPTMIADGSVRVISRRDYGSLTGARKTSEYVLERLAIGDWSATSLYAYEGRRCRIGLQYLSRFVVTIDFPNHVLYLHPVRDMHP